MADSTLLLKDLMLNDLWPGVPTVRSKPLDGFTGSAHHNVATEKYRLGTKIQLYHDGGTDINQGYSTFIYLRAAADAETAPAMAVTSVVCVDGTPESLTTANKFYVVTNDSDLTSVETGSPCAIALSTMTNSYYGWFWCGGVCPTAEVSGLTITSTAGTDDSVVVGNVMLVAMATTAIGFAKHAVAGPAVGIFLKATDGG